MAGKPWALHEKNLLSLRESTHTKLSVAPLALLSSLIVVGLSGNGLQSLSRMIPERSWEVLRACWVRGGGFSPVSLVLML